MSSKHAYNFTLQKYMLLQEQHEELCTHLDQIRPRQSSTASSSISTITSPSSSPTRSSFSTMLSPQLSASSATPTSTRRHHSRSSGRASPKMHARCSGWQDARRRSEALDTIVDEDTVFEISAEEQRLCDVNEGIKRALTEMLNCDTVRNDMNMRMWVQTRLMETEKELRTGRRRKGSSSSE
jgi:hypothetical protein